MLGIYGVDTRALTRHIRSVGAMNGAISTEVLDPGELQERIQSAPTMAGLNLVKEVTTPTIYEWSEPTDSAWEFSSTLQTADGESGQPPYTVVALDFGIKRNILRRLVSYGCRVIVVPANTPVADILSYNPDGIFLSNGPGDPAANQQGIATVSALMNQETPIFGICMGHQILGLSLGGESFKLKFGHRGLNHPCGLRQQVEITSQNHGFAIHSENLMADVEITHLNLNDRTIAGLKHKTLPIFSVQYHPEASPGPHDSDYLFAQFVQAMEQTRTRV